MTRQDKIDNRPILNLYPDSLGGNASHMISFLKQDKVMGAFGSVYLLPSIYHSDLDRGFSVIDYDLNEEYITQEDIEQLKALGLSLKLDFVLNHASVQSPQFKDLLENGEESAYKDFFIDWNAFWDGYGEMSEEGYIIPDKKYTDKMFFRKPGLPLLMLEFKNGKKVPYWNTFYQEVKETSDSEGNICKSYLGQMDLNIKSEKVWGFYDNTLSKLADYGAEIVRLDAFAYAPKKPGEPNFLNEPDTWTFLHKLDEMAKSRDIKFLPEIHATYQEKIYEKIASKGYMTYDFFLPGLILDAFEQKSGNAIKLWADELVQKKIQTVNMLGCHDGIPVLDLRGLLPEERIENLIKVIVDRGGYLKDLHGNKNMYYQVNATFFSALGEDEKKMLIARAIQMFMPGKPQVWYLDLFAGKNDYEAVERAGAGGHKEINRTNLSLEEIEKGLTRDIVQKQLALLKFRTEFPAFSSDADFEMKCEGALIIMSYKYDGYVAELHVNLDDLTYEVHSSI